MPPLCAQISEVLQNRLDTIRESILRLGPSLLSDGADPINARLRRRDEQLATLVNMAPTAFIRFFREKTGKTPAKYFGEIRAERIAELLELTDWPIERIAESCGYADRYHMSKAFRRATGTSPARWRKERPTNIMA